MTIIEQIKAEIERRIALYSLLSENTVNPNRIDEDRQLLSFLDTLESEKPTQEGLGEEIGSYMSNKWKFGCITPITPVVLPNFTTEDLKECARHFAKWGAEHLADNKVVSLKPGDEIAINGYKLVYDKNENAIRVAKVEPNGSSKDLEEAAEEYLQKVKAGFLRTLEHPTAKDCFIHGAKWQAEHSPLPEDTVLFNKGVEEGKRQMMEEFPKWRKIKAGERLPCPAYVWTIAYDNYPDCFEGRLMPNIEGVKVGRDTWYLPVDVIHNLPKED